MVEYLCYARISPRPEAKETIQTQTEVFREYVDKAAGTNIGEFEDELLSGGRNDTWKRGDKKGKFYRPGIHAAVELACRRKATLVAYHMDRLARDMVDICQIVKDVTESGAAIVTLTGLVIDTTTPVGNLTFHIMAAINEYERTNGAQRTSAVMLHHQANGRRMSDKPPYGKKIDPDDPARLIRNRTEHNNIELIKDLRAEGKSLRVIAQILDSRKIVTRKGTSWERNFSLVQKIVNRLKDEGVVFPATEKTSSPACPRGQQTSCS